MRKSYTNWGIIGCARIALSNAIPAIKESKNAKLYGVGSRNPKKLEILRNQDTQLVLYDTYEAILDDKNVDVVYIPLPNSMHLEWVLKAARKKKHILCEKPLGLSAKQVLKMYDEAEKNDVIIMEAFAYRHSPILSKVKELIDNGEIGPLKFIETHYAFSLDGYDDFRLNKAFGGGAVYDVGCYNYNFMRFITGQDPEKIITSAEVCQKTGVDMSCINIFEYSNGLKGVSVCAMNHALCEGYRIVGTKGLIEVKHDYNAKGDLDIHLTKNNKEERIDIMCTDNYMLEIEYISKCILDKDISFIDFEDSYKTALVTDKVLSQINKGVD